MCPVKNGSAIHSTCVWRGHSPSDDGPTTDGRHFHTFGNSKQSLVVSMVPREITKPCWVSAAIILRPGFTTASAYLLEPKGCLQRFLFFPPLCYLSEVCIFLIAEVTVSPEYLEWCTHALSPAFKMIFFLAVAAAAVVAVIHLLKYFLTLSHDGLEPPEVAPGTTAIGHVLGIIRQGSTYYSKFA